MHSLTNEPCKPVHWRCLNSSITPRPTSCGPIGIGGRVLGTAYGTTQMLPRPSPSVAPPTTSHLPLW